METCCYCLELKAGAYFLGSFDIVWGIFCYAALGRINELKDTQVFGTFILIASIFFAILALTAGILIYGASISDPFYIKPWIIANYILIGFLIIQMICFLILNYLPYKLAIVLVITIAIRIYFAKAMSAFRAKLLPPDEE